MLIMTIVDHTFGLGKLRMDCPAGCKILGPQFGGRADGHCDLSELSARDGPVATRRSGDSRGGTERTAHLIWLILQQSSSYDPSSALCSLLFPLLISFGWVVLHKVLQVSWTHSKDQVYSKKTQPYLGRVHNPNPSVMINP